MMNPDDILEFKMGKQNGENIYRLSVPINVKGYASFLRSNKNREFEVANEEARDNVRKYFEPGSPFAEKSEESKIEFDNPQKPWEGGLVFDIIRSEDPLEANAKDILADVIKEIGREEMGYFEYAWHGDTLNVEKMYGHQF